jgi:hypothetical protein
VVELLGAAVRYAAALFLLYVAAQKLAAPRPFRETLMQLRVPVVTTVAALVPLAEVAAAVCLVAAPRSVVSILLVGGLGIAFAGAALVAMRRGERIRCACYGRSGDAHLGPRQLVAVPVWLAVAAVGWFAPAGWSAGVPHVAVLTLGLGLAVAVLQVLPPLRRNWTYHNVLVEQSSPKVAQPR